MRPAYIALIFWGLSACAVFGISKCLRTGIAQGEFFTYREDRNPVSFWLEILGRVLIIVFAIAETLYAFGLTGDPLVALRSIMPFQQ